MATVQKVIDVEASVEEVWGKIAKVGSISDIIGFLTESQLEGDVRVCKMADGAILEEKIISIDNVLRRVSYSITNSPFNFEFHSASMQVLPKGEGSSMIWITDVKPDSLAEQLDTILEEALPGMKSVLEGS